MAKPQSDPYNPSLFTNPLLNEGGVTHWTGSFTNSPIPLMIVDKSLDIIWFNAKFHQLFSQVTGFTGKSIFLFFDGSLDTKSIDRLKADITSNKSSFTWKGRVEKKDNTGAVIVSNLLILPTFYDTLNIQAPIAYVCLLDNVSEEYKHILKMTFMSLLEASRLKDSDTGNHINRVNLYSRIIAESLTSSMYKDQITSEFIEDIGFLASMHDVGKIGTPDDILNKKGPLESWEREIMEEHTINGAFILSTYPNPMAKLIALFHHEKWDGSGYPYGLHEQMIPLCARIVTIADIYDALRMKRSYKESFSHQKTSGLILSNTGKQFDPVIIEEGFLRVEKKMDEIFNSMNI